MNFADKKERLLSVLTQRLIEEKDLNSLANALYDELRGLLNIHRLGIAVLTDDKKHITSRLNLSTTKLKLYKGYKVPLDSSSLRAIINSGKSRIIPDLDAYLKAKPTSVSTRLILSEGMKSSVTLPLLVNQKVIGVLFLSSQETNAFQEDHISFVEDFSNIIALGLERALLLERLDSAEKALNISILENVGLSDALKKKVEKNGMKPDADSSLVNYPSPLRFDSPMSWQAWEREVILYTLSQSSNKIYGAAGAAELLELAPTTLQSKMKRLGIRKKTDS
jgi:transcriptional regulator with GAF, ATPase, and Fis domain